jgi:hypothetical protein
MQTRGRQHIAKLKKLKLYCSKLERAMIMNQRKVFLPAGCLLSQVGLPAEGASDVMPGKNHGSPSDETHGLPNHGSPACSHAGWEEERKTATSPLACLLQQAAERRAPRSLQENHGSPNNHGSPRNGNHVLQNSGPACRNV